MRPTFETASEDALDFIDERSEILTDMIPGEIDDDIRELAIQKLREKVAQAIEEAKRELAQNP